MNSKYIFIDHPQTIEKTNALKAFMKALNIKFEISKKEGYNPDFIKKILDSEEERKNGKVTRIEKNLLNEFLGLDVMESIIKGI